MKILHIEFDKYSKSCLNKLSKLGKVFNFDFKNQKELHNHLLSKEYNVIFTRLGVNINKEIIDNQPNLRYIVTPTTGLNHIDIDYCSKKNINVISLKGEDYFLSQIKSTAEHTWALLLTLIRKIPQSAQSVNLGVWNRKSFIADELDGKNIGIIGYGRLGRIISSYAKAFGMNILINDINQSKFKDSEFDNTDLDELLKRSDFITLHIDYSKSNKGFMDINKFLKMKKGSYFVNTSRGECINEKSLIKVLKSNHLKGAALDVLDGDSSWSLTSPKGNKLIEYSRSNNNLIITPHSAGYGFESILRTRIFITNKFLNILNNETNNYS
mgnify:CR=1 FL=1|tara:strand:+ start:1477 stop:2454 length:978 start_codon:yes stop_codon:yes gene_type:complete